MNYQPLFDLMTEHGLTLLEGEMEEIVNCVNQLQPTHAAVDELDLEEAAEAYIKNKFGQGRTHDIPQYAKAGYIAGAQTKQSKLVELIEALRSSQYSEKGIKYDDGYYDALTDLLTKLNKEL